MEWILRPVRPKVAMFYGASLVYFWMLAREPFNPAAKAEPSFNPDCYFDQIRKKVFGIEVSVD